FLVGFAGTDPVYMAPNPCRRAIQRMVQGDREASQAAVSNSCPGFTLLRFFMVGSENWPSGPRGCIIEFLLDSPEIGVLAERIATSWPIRPQLEPVCLSACATRATARPGPCSWNCMRR